MTDGGTGQVGRTVTAVTEQDQRIAAEFADGREMDDIAARYNVPVAYVERVIEDATMAGPEPRQSMLQNQWIRALAAAGIALLSWLIWPVPGTPLLIFVAAYVLLTTIIVAGRRS
jgi:hypothetical protein